MNYGWWGENGGQYLVRFENLSKTVGREHVPHRPRRLPRASGWTARATTRAAWTSATAWWRARTKDEPAMGALDRDQGWRGVLHQHQAQLRDGPTLAPSPTRRTPGWSWSRAARSCSTNTWVNRASATPETVPVVAVSGGRVHVTRTIGMGGNWKGHAPGVHARPERSCRTRRSPWSDAVAVPGPPASSAAVPGSCDYLTRWA